MNTSNYRFTLDMQSNISQVSLPVRKGDTCRKLYINLTDSGSPYIIEDGCYAVFSATKADGKSLFNTCIIEKNTTIRYDFTEQTVSYAGVVDCEIRLYGTDGKLITSPRFIIVVDERVVSDTNTVSEEEHNILEDIVSSENSRREAEIRRETAEAARTAAEADRDTRFSQKMDHIDERVQHVLDIADGQIDGILEDAQAANQSAQGALSAANDALESANDALNEAENAKDAALEAAAITVSPEVSVEAIEGGHRVTVKDVNGTKTFDVMNGTDGENSTPYSYGTEDLTAGSSPLETGKLYFVYE